MRTEPLPRADARPLNVEIDGHAVSVPDGHERAARGGARRRLHPFAVLRTRSSRRSAAVACAWWRSPACAATPWPAARSAQQDMKVTTDTDTLREMRREVLQLILSEHPSSCLFCDEKDECRRNQTTIRKAGVSTGCRSCPNDGECELQQVVERVGITDIGYPITYRGLEAEHDDPFYDRDYNLCILCGRCVRMCDEVRGTSVLVVQVPRPQGAHRAGLRQLARGGRLRVLRRLRVGLPHGGARRQGLQVGRQAGRARDLHLSLLLPRLPAGAGPQGRPLSWARGAYDAEINDGQLCVRGRFCMPETTHHYCAGAQAHAAPGRAYFRVARLGRGAGRGGRRSWQGSPPDELPDARLERPHQRGPVRRPAPGAFRPRLAAASTPPPAPTCRAARPCGRASSRCPSR